MKIAPIKLSDQEKEVLKAVGLEIMSYRLESGRAITYDMLKMLKSEILRQSKNKFEQSILKLVLMKWKDSGEKEIK